MPDLIAGLRAYDNGQPGMYAPQGPNVLAVGNGAFTAQKAYLLRVYPTRAYKITSLGFMVVTAAGSDDNVDVGIYDANLNRIVSSGATAGKLNAAPDNTTVTITETELQPATVYYLAITTGAFGGTAPSFRGVTTTAYQFAQMFGTSAPKAEVLTKTGLATLPAQITSPSVGSGNVPFMVARES